MVHFFDGGDTNATLFYLMHGLEYMPDGGGAVGC
jgi:hypothetical protein